MATNLPEHWERLQGPVNWFSLRRPPQWTVSERSSAVTLQPPGGGGFLALHSFLAEDGAESSGPPALDRVAAQFPRVRGLRPLRGEKLPHLHESLEGRADMRPGVSGWRRLLGRPDWRRWMMWSFVKGRVTIVATLLHDAAYDAELTSLVRMVLSSLEIVDRPADVPDVFAERVLQLARKKFPLLECRRSGEFQLKLAESTVNLFNLYRSYIKNPDRFEELLLPALTTVVQVQEWGESQTTPPLDAVRDRVMPMLYPEEVWRNRFPGFVGRPWIAGLVILYVIDESQAYWYLRNDLLARWRISDQELHKLAMDNLQRYFDRQPMEMAVAGSESDGPTMLMPGRADSYNSARLLSEPFLTRMREVIGGDFAVGVPGRDFFVAVNLKSARMIDHVRRRVREDYAQMDHPLTDRLLLASADGVSELVEDFDLRPPSD